jgi:hypothetical protein
MLSISIRAAIGGKNKPRGPPILQASAATGMAVAATQTGKESFMVLVEGVAYYDANQDADLLARFVLIL